MNKIKYKKMAEALAQGRDLKQLFSKEEAKQFIQEQLIKKIILAVSPWLGKIIVVCLVIGVLLAIFFIIFEQLAMIWEGITKAWGHLWSGTMSQVSDDDVSVLYYDLLQQGVDFEEIGAVGEHNYIKPGGFWGTKTWLESFIDQPKLREEVEKELDTNNEREKYSLQYYLDRVTTSDIRYIKINKSKLDYVNSSDKDRKLPDVIEMVDGPQKETLEQAAARMLSEKLLVYKNGSKVGKTGYENYDQLDLEYGIGVYLKRYLMAEKETFSQRNDWSVVGEGFKGGIIIDGGERDLPKNDLTIVHFTPLGVPFTVLQWISGIATEEVYQVERDDDNGIFYASVNTSASKVDSHNVINSSYDIDFANVITEENKDIKYDITQEVMDYAMPWQYPFAFHQNTLCPDVGYEVALMSHKYHNLYLQVRNVESGLLKIYDDGGSLRHSESIYTPDLFVRQMSTWYETIDYDHSQDPNSPWHGVAENHAINYGDIDAVNRFTDVSQNGLSETVKMSGILIETKRTETTHSHHGSKKRCGHGDTEISITRTASSIGIDEDLPDPKTVSHEPSTHKCNHGNGSYAECTRRTTDYYTYERLVVAECQYVYEKNPVVTISDTVAKQEEVTLTGIEAMQALLLPDPEINGETKEVTNYDAAAKYYRANDLSKKTDKNGNEYTKDLLFISTSAQSIIKSLYDLYTQSSDTYEPIDYEDIEHVIDNEDSSFMVDKSTPKYLTLEGNVKPVINLIQFFAANGIIDASSVYGLSEANSFAIMSQWFIDGGQVVITQSGNIATLQTGSGREVSAPITGTIQKVTGSDYIYIKTDKLGTIYLNNIQLDSSIQIGQTITKGQKIGVTTGNVSYYRTDDAGQEVESPIGELKQIQTIQFSDYAWPVPDSGNITSSFGARTDPITGNASKHNGVDIGAKAGTPIVAYMDGEICKATYDSDGYGNYIIIKHSDGCYTLYGHMAGFAKTSGKVKKNEVIGYVGSTGRSTGPHLHFEYRTGPNYGDAKDPMSFLKNYSYY